MGYSLNISKFELKQFEKIEYGRYEGVQTANIFQVPGLMQESRIFNGLRGHN